MSAIAKDMGREHSGGARPLAHFHHEFIGRAVPVTPAVGFVRDHDIANECLDLVRDRVGARALIRA
jgi:hypothetical protein